MSVTKFNGSLGRIDARSAAFNRFSAAEEREYGQNETLLFFASPASPELFEYLIAASSSTNELNAVFSEVCSLVLADGSASGGPKITAVNGVWIDQSFPVDSSRQDLLVNFFKAEFAQVDFSTKAEIVRKEVNAWASRHTNNLIQDVLPEGSKAFIEIDEVGTEAAATTVVVCTTGSSAFAPERIDFLADHPFLF
ncbi:hypothetical protein YC2023_114770 [Brassica napus]